MSSASLGDFIAPDPPVSAPRPPPSVSPRLPACFLRALLLFSLLWGGGGVSLFFAFTLLKLFAFRLDLHISILYMSLLQFTVKGFPRPTCPNQLYLFRNGLGFQYAANIFHGEGVPQIRLLLFDQRQYGRYALVWNVVRWGTSLPASSGVISRKPRPSP